MARAARPFAARPAEPSRRRYDPCRDEAALVQAVAAAGESVTARVPGACTALLEAMVGCGFRIGAPTLVMASRLFIRPELYLPSGPILY